MNVEHLVNEQIDTLYNKASSIYKRNFERPTVKFTLKGRSAGMAYSNNVVNFNKTFLSHNVDEFVKQTVPHEIAHLIAHNIYGTLKHDTAWKQVMLQFGVEPKRCHSYSIPETACKEHRIFKYKCACMIHDMSIVRHNKMLKGKKYRCTHCKCDLVRV